MGNYLKVAKAAGRILAARFLGVRVPLLVGWALTNRCNYQCVYCRRWNLHTHELHTKEVLSIISTLAEMGTYRINFTGGEPLLRDDLQEIIVCSVRKGIQVGVNSNGAIVSKKIGILKDVSVLGLSLDGPEEVHDRLRHVGSYNAVMDAVGAARRHNIRVVFNSLITAPNTAHLGHILDTARSLKVKVVFSLVEPIPVVCGNVEALRPDVGDFRAAIDWLIAEKRKGNQYIGNSPSALRYFRNWPRGNMVSRCVVGRIYCRIEPDGSVYGCVGALTRAAIISCRQDGFRKVFGALEKVCPYGTCWCGNRVEMNSVFALRLDSVWNVVSGWRCTV